MTAVETTAPGKRGNRSKKYLEGPERERQILEAAIAYVSRRGLAFSTREMAEELGISQPLLYRYFANKDELLQRIFDEVYLKNWDPRWNIDLADRSVPMRDRLVRYLRAYTATILDEHWIRIFIASALDDPQISKRYLGMLHETTFPLIFKEIAAEANACIPEDAEFSEIAREIIWGFHSSFFYLGVRKFIYRGELPKDIDAVICARVDVLLNGLCASLPNLSYSTQTGVTE
ncbi:TetR/AcrR family transcriptional regulator [Cypionkella sp.]|uniref:TetR/AcrR family transcriptional regulator n=1 Tax=Cypionkella sp. TaxID=2811411 RepID=UPI002ABAA1C3|nr:TetR/AcrR family transcriptional regulator [Cypionkella sp.]MDZ4394457.1 TetR/AcrR family transcriptional regulator [Cypionkella sp.]